jgi:Phosphotransferase enzyme family
MPGLVATDALGRRGRWQDGLVPETHRPTVGMDTLTEWCRHWLGAPPAAELFGTGYLSAVTGLRLTDGREVVVKVRRSIPRLTGCAIVHRAMWRAGFPCPEPLVDLQPLNGYVASAEVLVADIDDSPDGDVAALSAAALARLVELAPSPGSVPSLTPSPSWVGWDHTEPGLWPRPEDRDTDLNTYSEPHWLDRVAVAVRDRLLAGAGAGDLVIGHGDWWPGNLRWQRSELHAVHDWDSAAFLYAYQRARGCRWTSADCATFWAAGLWQRAFDAKIRSLDGDPDQVLTQHEARARLDRAGLNPDLVADGNLF